MTTVELRYNPFKAETTLTVDGREMHLNCFGTGEGYHLADWKNNFFPQLIKKLNKGPGTSCAVIFYGLQEDYNEIVPVHVAYREQNKDIIVFLDYGTLPPVTLAEKEALVQKAISPGDSPIKALTSTDFTEKVNSILHNQTPAFKYLEPAEKLLRIVTDYRQLFDGLGLKDQLEKDLANKKTTLDKAIADIEAKRKIEAEKKLEARSYFDELEHKIAASKKEIIEAVYEKNFAGGFKYFKEQGRYFDSNFLKASISKQIEDYVSRLNEYVTIFPGKPTLEDLGVDIIDIKNLSDKLQKSILTNIISPTIFQVMMPILKSYAKLDLNDQLVAVLNKTYAPLITQKVADYFTDLLNKINAVLKEKIAQERKRHEISPQVQVGNIRFTFGNLFENLFAPLSARDLEIEIAAVEKQIEWLAAYTRRLDSVLEV